MINAAPSGEQFQTEEFNIYAGIISQNFTIEQFLKILKNDDETQMNTFYQKMIGKGFTNIFLLTTFSTSKELLLNLSMFIL